MELSWCPPSRTNGRESNSVVASPPARAAAEASRARTNALGTDIDRSIDVKARPGIGRTGDEDVAAGVHRPGMAAGAVGEDDPAVRTDAGRHAVARTAERLRGPERPRRRAQRGRGVAGELRPAAVAVAARTGRAVPGGRCAVGDGEPGEGDGCGKRVIEMSRAVDLRRYRMAGRATDRRGDERLAEEVRLVGADAAGGSAAAAGQVARWSRRLRAAVARGAGGRTPCGHLEGVAALARNRRLAAGEVVPVAMLAIGEVPPGVPHQVAVELRVVRIEDSALVDAGAEERELPVHHPGAHGGVGPRDRLVDRIGAGWIDGLEQERVRLTRHRNPRLKGNERPAGRGGPVAACRVRPGMAGVAARGGEG